VAIQPLKLKRKGIRCSRAARVKVGKIQNDSMLAGMRMSNARPAVRAVAKADKYRQIKVMRMLAIRYMKASKRMAENPDATVTPGINGRMKAKNSAVSAKRVMIVIFIVFFTRRASW